MTDKHDPESFASSAFAIRDDLTDEVCDAYEDAIDLNVDGNTNEAAASLANAVLLVTSQARKERRG